MTNTVDENLSAEINRINSIIGNETIQPECFINLTTRVQDEFDTIGSIYGSCSYVFNLTDSPIAYSRRDGVVIPVAPLSVNSVFDWLRTKYDNSVLIVDARVIDLGLFDPDIGRVFSNDRRISNREAAGSHSIFEDNIVPDGRQQFPYQRDMEDIIRKRFELLKSHHLNSFNIDERDFVIDNQTESVIKCITAYQLTAGAFNGPNDIYVPHVDMVFRKLNKVTATRKSKNKDVNYSKLDVIQSTPLKHPLIDVDTISMIRGVNQALANHTYVSLIRVQYWRNRSNSNVVFLIRNKEIIELSLKLVDSQQDEGIIVTEKNASGQIIETVYPIEDAAKYDLYWKYEDALAAKTLIDRENDVVETRIKAEEAKIRAEFQEAQAKEKAAEEKKREAEASRVKGELNNKSDVLKLVAQGVALVAALATAVVTLVKLFSPSRLFGFGMFGLAA